MLHTRPAYRHASMLSQNIARTFSLTTLCCVCKSLDDHVHMLFKCSCPKKCPTRNYRVECTIEMLLDIVPRENVCIHENAIREKPVDPEVLAALPTRCYNTAGKASACDQEECYVCQEAFADGDEMCELPCSHLFHKVNTDSSGLLLLTRLLPCLRHASHHGSGSRTPVQHAASR